MKIRRAKDRGHADHGWLKSAHTFSFADYHDPDYMGVSVLRVINEDRVAPGKGFGTHPHRDMEILSYVLEGSLEHRDSMGNGSVIQSGELQLMSAGRGVSHSEFNASDKDPVHFYQIWILPKEKGREPRYEQKLFSDHEKLDNLKLVGSSDGTNGSLHIAQDVKIYLSIITDNGLEYAAPAGRTAWLQVLRGEIKISNKNLSAGDGIELSSADSCSMQSENKAEIMIFEMP